jgi:two-component system response regulator HydG
MARMLDYPWPGNIRELSHVVQRVVVLGRHRLAELEDLPHGLSRSLPEVAEGFAELVPARVMQHRYAVWALERSGGHKSRTAESLGLDIKTLNRWLQDPPPAETLIMPEEDR